MLEDAPVYVGLGITLYHLLGSTALLLEDSKQQELTSLMLETPFAKVPLDGSNTAMQDKPTQ